MITFVCACGQSIRVESRFAGKTGRCARCGQKVRIPGGDEPAARQEVKVEEPSLQACQASPAGTAADDAPAAPVSRRKLHSPQWLIPVVCGSLMLLTILLPWIILDQPAAKAGPFAGKTVLMSWHMFRGPGPAAFRTFIIIGWVIGLASIVIGITVRRLPLAICLASFGLLSLVVQLVGLTFGTALVVLLAIQQLMALLLIVITSLRMRQGGRTSVRITQSIAGGLLALAAIIFIITAIAEFNEESVELDLMPIVWAFITALTIGLAHIAAGVLSLVHGAAVRIVPNTISRVSRALSIGSFGLLSVACLIAPFLAPSDPWAGRVYQVFFMMVLNVVLLILPALALLCVGAVLTVEGIVRACGGWMSPISSSSTANSATLGREPDKLQQRLQQLTDLHSDGIISDQEHRAARQKLLEGLGAVQLQEVHATSRQEGNT